MIVVRRNRVQFNSHEKHQCAYNKINLKRFGLSFPMISLFMADVQNYSLQYFLDDILHIIRLKW